MLSGTFTKTENNLSQYKGKPMININHHHMDQMWTWCLQLGTTKEKDQCSM